MKILHVPKRSQPGSAFDGGKIEERRIIAFPQDRGMLTAYSNIFYWAYAWGNEDGLVAEHQHKGFEIMSYVITGRLEHYDSLRRDWNTLESGDAQIMQAGAGISHAERVTKGTEFMQIWFDPGLRNSLELPARYTDYAQSQFPVRTDERGTTRAVIGNGSPVDIGTPVTVRDTSLHAGQHDLELAPGNVCSLLLLQGAIEADGVFARKGDFLVVEETEKVPLRTEGESRIFVIESPKIPEYDVYSTFLRLS